MVTLYYDETPDIKISMRLYFNDKNQLFFDGYDIGTQRRRGAVELN